jgi:hypothetical protein
MRNKYLLLSILCLIALSGFAQNIQYQVDGDDLYYGSDCGDCYSGPDPRWNVRVAHDGANWSNWNVSQEDISCPSWRNVTNYSWRDYTTAAYGSDITVQFDGYEDDDWTCGGDDNVCGGYGTIGVHDITDNLPCQWQYYTEYRSCGAQYGVEYSVYWKYDFSPTILTQPAANTALCIGSNTTLSVVVNTDGNGRSLGRFYQWQISNNTDCSGAANWQNLPGATSSTYTPYQIAGTRLYRCLITSNCSADFSSFTATSSCARVTYNTQNGTTTAPVSVPYYTGDNAPNVQGLCGATVLPGSVNTFSALLPPNAGAVANVTYSWSVSAGTLSASTGNSVDWTLPTTAGTYTLTLTYVDACGTADITRTCSLTVGSPACNYTYVAPAASGGSDVSGCGGPDNPCATLSYAITNIASGNHIKMLTGSYTQNSIVDIPNNIIIEGGYEKPAGIWLKRTNPATRTAINFTAEGTGGGTTFIMGLRGINRSGFRIQDLDITTSAASGTDGSGNGKSNYAVYLSGCSAYAFERCNISSGNATAGNIGTSASNGNNGNNGGDGGDPGQCWNGFDSSRPGGGGGGGGGAGGSGPAGNGGSGCNGGGGGSGGEANACNGGNTGGQGGCTGGNGGGGGGASGGGNSGGNGAGGLAGTAGANGGNGTFSFTSGYAVGTAGGNGTAGSGGRGGGGGGGGGCGNSGTDEAGKGGAGGGGGGGGGGAATGGRPSGSSIGVMLWSNTGGSFTDCTINTGNAGSVTSGGTGGNGGTGGTAGNGGGINTGSCSSGNGGAGGRGGDGGRGGNGGSGAAGVRYAVAYQSSTSAPAFNNMAGTVNSTTSFTTTIPTTPAVTVDAQNGKLCTNSVIALTKASGNWTLPGGIAYIDENGPNDGAASYTSASSPANVYATTANSWYGITGPLTYNNLFRVLDARTLPTINTIAAPCVGGNITPTLGSGSYGTVVDHEWEVFSGTSASGSPIFTSTGSATPTIGPFTTAGTYIVKYKQREQCCGWSIPIYSATFTVVADPSAPNALTKTSGSNIPDVCIGATGLGVNATTVATGGAGTCNVEYSFFTPEVGTWSAWSTSVPSSINAGAATGQVKVKARTNCNGSGCDISPETAEVVWNVVEDPIAGSISRGTVQQSIVCAGTSLDVAVTGGSGGVAPTTDAIQYRIGTSGGWTAYSGAFTANTAGDYYFQTQRTSSVNGCTASGWSPSGNGSMLYTVIAAPVQKTVSVTTSPICSGGSSTIVLNSSENAVSYRLWNVTDNTFSATQVGDGTNLTFTTGALTATKTFKIIATLSPCSDVNMNSDVAVTVTVVTSAPSAVTASANSLALCVGNSFNLNATGGTGAASWSWTGPNSYTNTNQDPAAFTTVSASAGNYVATATNVCGSTTSNTLTLGLSAAAPGAVTASANSLLLCVGSPFDLNASGGAGATSWSWSGPNSYTDSNQDPASFGTVAASAGNYTATATNACGSTSSSALALALTLSTPSAVTASANSLSLCTGASFDLNASGGTGATSWSWSGPDSYTNSIQNPAAFSTSATSAGNYTATATNVCGSTSSSAITLALTASVPSAVTASANSLAMCAGSPFDLNATGGTGATSWSWGGPNGYGSTSQDPASFNTVAASGGNYIATATNVCGNATSNTLALAVTAAVPSAVTASATSANLCETQPLDLEATGGTGATSWSWTGPNSYSNSVQDPVSFITSSASTGNYVATATNICGSTVSNSLAVTVVTGPINKSVTSTTTICSGTSGTVQLVNSEPGTVYQLYNTTDNVNVGATQTGNGSTLSFSTGALANDKTYKIIGSRNPCTALDMNFGADVNVYVVTTGSWKGSLSDNWFDGGNWCLGGGIPTSSTDITIPTGSITDFDPVIASNGAVCRSINLNSGSIMTINNTRNLDVWGTWNNSGTFNYNVSTVTFKGTGNVILTGFTDPQEFYNLRVDKGTDITPLLSIETNTVVYGNLQPINGLAQVKADLELYNGPTIASTAGVEVTTDILQGNFRADGLNVTNNGLYSVISGTDSLNNLTNSSTATYTHAGGTSVLTGNVANTGATVTAAGGVLNVGGNWSNASSSTVTYSGATIAIVGDYSSSGSTVNANSATVSIGGKYTNSSSSTLSLGGAIVSVGGNYVSTGSSINQTGGAMTLNTTGASYNANAILDLDATSNLNISSGTIFFQRANGGTGNDLVIAAGGTKTITGGTFQFGNASSPASQVFKVNNSAVDFNNFNVNNSSSNNPRVQLLANAATRSTGVLTVDGVLDLNGYTFNVKNGATTGIVAGGYVISETSGGTSKLAWNIGNNTGTYVYPFGTAAGDFIPFTFSVTGAGVQSGAGNVTLSTYPTGDDNTPWVSGVQHMNFDQGPGTGTDATLDRWWIIDANNYTTRPTSNMTFKYASSDLSGNSSILEDNLKAQRWNATGGPDSLGGWDLPTEYGIVSTANAADNTVTASGVSRYSPWVLHDGESSGNSPLPIELVDFKASCTNDVVTINWTTATEINNDFFTVQRSADLATYDNVALVQGAGNSNTYRNYSAKDLYPLAGTAYYRLMQTDYNGEYEVFSPVTVSCVIKGSDVISVFPNPAQDRLNVSMNLSTSDRGRIMIYNHYGQLVESMFVEPKAGANIYDFDLGNLAQGQYFVSFSMENKVLPTQKVVITR